MRLPHALAAALLAALCTTAGHAAGTLKQIGRAHV